MAIKVLSLLILINLIFALLDPLPFVAQLNLYNTLFPGRPRLPYGDDPERSYNLTVNQLDAMFASHLIEGAEKREGEYRVFLIGDSSVWGFLQSTTDTLAARLNRYNLYSTDGRKAHFYNLGYPTLSVTKDLLLLEYAEKYQPDLILWFVTLESLPIETQLSSPVLTLNPQATIGLIQNGGLQLQAEFSPPDFWGKTILGRRRILADMIRHQIYGVLWTATGIDHHIPETFDRRTEDLSDEIAFKGIMPGDLSPSDLAFDVLQTGLTLSDAPVIFVNEPIFRSEGANSDIRYNFYYPIWAYDRYRALFTEVASRQGWIYIDLWDLLPGDVFTDSAIHYDVEGVDIVITALLSSGNMPFEIR